MCQTEASMMQGNRTEKYEQMRKLLNEKQWRQYLALEAKEESKLEQIAAEAGVSQNTIRRGLRELEAGDLYTPGARQRKAGGGRKKVVQKDETMLVAYDHQPLRSGCWFSG